MLDLVIDAAMADSLHEDALRMHPIPAWVITRDQVDYPGDLVARLVTNMPTQYVLLADTLGGLQNQLPIGLVYVERQPSDPPEVVEIWIEPPTAGAS
jgi:hypothetical protein